MTISWLAFLMMLAVSLTGSGFAQTTQPRAKFKALLENEAYTTLLRNSIRWAAGK